MSSVLNKHLAEIYILDNIDAESAAMLQAFYSRSMKSIKDRAEELGFDLSPEYKPSKIKDALKEYYINYGHGSIGKQGVTYVFFENVSMLFAKALQAHPLYAGQETSSRYIDFTKQKRWAPEGIRELAQTTYEKFIGFVDRATPVLFKHLDSIYTPTIDAALLNDASFTSQYQRALKARAFDILRGFLPAGSLTNVSWTTSLQNARDHLRLLRRHPLTEVSSTAEKCLMMLHQRYPSAFKEEDYTSEISEEELKLLSKTMYQTTEDILNFDTDTFEVLNVFPSRTLSSESQANLNARFAPHILGMLGNLTASFNLDFGSYRDIQRHQRGFCNVPLLALSVCYPELSEEDKKGHNFHPWYLNQLPEDLRTEALQLLDELKEEYMEYLDCLGDDKDLIWKTTTELQYVLPLGTLVPVFLQYSFVQAKYVAELRSKAAVHPTLRPVAQAMGNVLKQLLPNVDITIDNTEDGLNISRGGQTIFIKSPSGEETQIA
jgi:thymidylate synthase ThyX